MNEWKTTEAGLLCLLRHLTYPVSCPVRVRADPRIGCGAEQQGEQRVEHATKRERKQGAIPGCAQ